MPWRAMESVPASVAKHKGVALTLEQANKWGDIYDSLRENSNVKEPAAAAWSTWEEIYEIKDGAWVKRQREAAESMLWVEEESAEFVESAIIERDKDGLPSKVKVLVIAEGKAATKGRNYQRSALVDLAQSGKLDNLKMYDQHAEGSERIPGAIFKARSMRDYLSYLVPGTAKFEENIRTKAGKIMNGITAVAKLIDRDFKYKVSEAAETMGLSLSGVLDALKKPTGESMVEKIRQVVSLDWLTGEPNCGGQVLEFVEAAEPGGGEDTDPVTSIKINVAEPGEFQDKAMKDGQTFTTVELPGVEGVTSMVGRKKQEGKMAAQSFSFDPVKWSVEEAQGWTERNGHQVLRVDTIRGKEVTEQMEWKDITADELKKNRPDLVTSLTSEPEAKAAAAETKAAESETKAAEAETKAAESETKAAEATTQKDQAVAEAAEFKKQLEAKAQEFAEFQKANANTAMTVKTIEAVESKCAGLNILGKAQVMKAVLGKEYKTEEEMAEAIEAEVKKFPEAGQKQPAPAADGGNEPALPRGSEQFAESIGLSEAERKRLAEVR